MKAWLLKQWERPAVRAALAVLSGALLSALCELAPVSFQVPCHAAARLVHLLGGK